MTPPVPSRPSAGCLAASLAAGLLALAAPAGAIVSDGARELREMRESLLALQDQVDAQQRRIEAQEERLREAGLDARGSASGLSGFLQRTDFRGWVAASYFWNVDDPRKPNAGGNGPFSNPFHPDHNSFQFDQAWFAMDRAPSEESPAGFHVEIVFGATATAFSQIENGSGGTGNLNGNDLWVPAANVSYLTPWGPTLTAGKFPTLIGYEVAAAPDNVNITRGFTYNLFQPISHTGLLASQRLDNGFGYALGVVNGFGTDQPNGNDSLGALWQIGWADDATALLLNGFYTDDLEGDGRERWLLDAVSEITPTDALIFWLNFDYLETAQDGRRPWGVGLAVGGHVAVDEKLGLGARAEYAHFDADGAATFRDGNYVVRPLDGDLWSLTGTLDYALSAALTGKLEVKFEQGDSGLGQSYRDGRDGSADAAVFLGSQLYYVF